MASLNGSKKDTESRAAESTFLNSGSDDEHNDDEISTTSSDDALCNILGLVSLSGMAMDVDIEETPPIENPLAIPTGIPSRIKLPSARGVSRKYYPPEECFAYEIKNILSPQECLELTQVAATSSLGAGNDDTVSSSFRYITHAMHTAPDGKTKFQVKLEKPNPHKLAVFRHEEWVKSIWSRIEPILSKTSPNHCEALDGHPTKSLKEDLDLFVQRESLSTSSMSNVSPIAGINPRLRVLKYDACDKDEFLGHFDATTEIHSLGQTSYITVLLYLNDGGGKDFDGGETEFLSQEDHGGEESEDPSLSKMDSIKIVPTAGTAVLFEHDLFHRGRPLLWGTKYVLRTDIMFVDRMKKASEEHKVSSPLSAASDNESTEAALSTVEDVLCQIDQEVLAKDSDTTSPKETHESSLGLLREALSEGMGFGQDLRDTSIECLCSPGRFALNLMLREYMKQPHQQKMIDRFLDVSFEALKHS